MARILFITSILSLFIFSCGDEKEKISKPNVDSVDIEQKIAITTSDTTELTDTLENKGKITMSEIMDAFLYCRETAENNLQCKYFIAKAICDYFGINDFKIEGEYIDFERILYVVRSNTKWKSIGFATSQNTLIQSQDFANRHKPVIAIQTNSKFGHVVIILPGKLEKAMNWGGLTVPKCASFFMIDEMEPFIDKSIAFAWGSPDGIEFFVRE